MCVLDSATIVIMDKREKLTDPELIERSKQDPESFGILMERYQWPLFHYLRRMGQMSREDTEDLLQEVFIKIYENLNGYRENMKFSSWAYRIAHNHLIDHFRRQNARPATSFLEDDEWERLVRSTLQLEKEIADKDCVRTIKKCIQNLPITYREILVLRFLEGKDYAEIMDILKKPKGTVATLIARSKAKLVQRLREKNINCF